MKLGRELIYIEILVAIDEHKSSKAKGFDGIPALLLKALVFEGERGKVFEGDCGKQC